MSAIELVKTPVTLESLRRDYEMISLESMTLTQTLKALPHRLPEFVADVKNFIFNMSAAKDAPLLAAIDTRLMERMLPKQNYVHMSDVTVFVPPSMNVEWNVYLDALSTSQTLVDGLLNETLSPALRYISVMLTQPENLASVRGKASEYNIVFHDIEAVRKKIAACYSKSGADAKVRYGDVFKNNNDALIAMKRTNELCEAMAKINRQEVITAVNEITDAMDKLLIRMKQYPDQYKMSGATMNDISKLAYNLGAEIEFFAAHVYMVQSASQAMLDSKDKIEAVLTR
jgi:hypothetical protein